MLAIARAEASERLWQQLNNSIDPELRFRLDALLTVEDGSTVLDVGAPAHLADAAVGARDGI